MAKYDVRLMVDGANLKSVQKKLKDIFGIEGQAVEKIEMRKSRADRLADAEELVGSARIIFEELQGEMQDWYDNIPENLQGSLKANEVLEVAAGLQEIVDSLEGVGFGNLSFPGMF